MASSFSLKNVTVPFSADSSRTVPVMYGAVLDLPRLLPQGHDKAERRREIEIQMQVRLFITFKTFYTDALHNNQCLL